jgi:hypothetical protein
MEKKIIEGITCIVNERNEVVAENADQFMGQDYWSFPNIKGFWNESMQYACYSIRSSHLRFYAEGMREAVASAALAAGLVRIAD